MYTQGTCSTCGKSPHEHNPTADELYQAAVAEAQRTGTVSIEIIQRRHFLGYGMAQKLLRRMTKEGIVIQPLPGGCWQVVLGNGTMLTDRELKDAYLGAMAGMMENAAVWETIKDRSSEDKDTFLFDRFKTAYGAFNIGMRFNEWRDLAETRGIESPLAQYIWDLHHKPF